MGGSGTHATANLAVSIVMRCFSVSNCFLIFWGTSIIFMKDSRMCYSSVFGFNLDEINQKIYFFNVLTRLFFSRFPQYNLPTFRIDQSGCLKKVRIGEEICLVRLVVDYLFITLLLTFNL